MSRIILMMSVSLDGYMSGLAGELDWQTVDDELHQHFNDWLGAAGGFLDGRVTWELMAQVWPDADADPQAPGPVIEFARIWRDMPKVVFSRTLTEAGWNTLVAREVVPEQIRALAGAAGGDLVIGGADLAATFLRLDLIDEFRLYVHPVVLGIGRPLFGPASAPVRLTLTGTQTFSSGVVQLRYERAPGAAG
jgi:dihydrofolate reductase